MSERPRVLVVDDQPEVRLVFRAALMGAGFEVDTAEDGLDALWRVSQSPPDVIVLDLGLPTMRGEAVLRALRADARSKSIPVVVATGDEQLPPLPVQRVLHKPFPTKALVEAVSEALRRSGSKSVRGTRKITTANH